MNACRRAQLQHQGAVVEFARDALPIDLGKHTGVIPGDHFNLIVAGLQWLLNLVTLLALESMIASCLITFKPCPLRLLIQAEAYEVPEHIPICIMSGAPLLEPCNIQGEILLNWCKVQYPQM